MSEPKRYDNFQYETKGGEYVRYDDYARLKADVERLTKAGDDLVFHIGNSDKALYQCADAWRAAKEGKQP